MKTLDKLRKKFKLNKKGLSFLFGISVIGFVSGVFFLTFISKNDQLLVKEYISTYIENIQNNKLIYIDLFKNVFLDNLTFILIVWLFGMSVIGIPINFFYYFVKMFILGFSITSFILTYKIKGTIYSLVYIVPHNIINILIFTILVYYSTNFSLTLIYGILKKKNINFKNIMNNYLKILSVSLLLILISSIYEAFLLPQIMNKLLLLFN